LPPEADCSLTGAAYHTTSTEVVSDFGVVAAEAQECLAAGSAEPLAQQVEVLLQQAVGGHTDSREV